MVQITVAWDGKKKLKSFNRGFNFVKFGKNIWGLMAANFLLCCEFAVKIEIYDSFNSIAAFKFEFCYLKFQNCKKVW